VCKGKGLTPTWDQKGRPCRRCSVVRSQKAGLRLFGRCIFLQQFMDGGGICLRQACWFDTVTNPRSRRCTSLVSVLRDRRTSLWHRTAPNVGPNKTDQEMCLLGIGAPQRLKSTQSPSPVAGLAPHQYSAKPTIRRRTAFFLLHNFVVEHRKTPRLCFTATS